MKKLTAVVIGYGMRGQAYAQYAVDNPEKLSIVAVADIAKDRLELAKRNHNISDDMLFHTWEDIVKQPKLADFAIISTQDDLHTGPAIKCMELGYDLLLEKPMAQNAKECKEIYEASEKYGRKVIVCHVLRFTQFWRTIKTIIDRGEIGRPMSMIHMENVGIMHQSHSFVRGNWRNSVESSPMILAKSCHDMDIMQWVIGKPCKKIQSFGDVTYFNKSNQPQGAPDRCADACPYAESCIFEPVRYYTQWKENPWRDTVANKVGATDEDIIEALKIGPYGRCVFACDNDVVDHQVVNMEFEGGCTASFTMSAFNKGGRFTKIFGDKGEMDANMETDVITVYNFKTEETKKYELDKIDETISSGHAGGDTGIMEDLLDYFGENKASDSVCSLYTSYMNHLMSFAAEESRLNDSIVNLDDFSNKI